MKLFVFASLLSLVISSQFNSYEQYLVFASKNHLKSVSQYAETIGFSQLDSQWEQFKTDFNRHFVTTEEEESRKFNFLKNIQYIESHNEDYKKGIVSHEVGINQFSDWTPEEYESMLGVKVVNITDASAFGMIAPEVSVYANLPSSFDWRQQGKVTAVKNQAQCGSCWAFATTASIEAAMLIHHNQRYSLSEQQMVDCSTQNNGCNGGNPGTAMQYAQIYGLESENDYRYVARRQACQNNNGKGHLKIKGWTQLRHPASDDDIRNAIHTYGPVAVMIDSSGNDFGQYRSGILRTGNKNINHVVTAVGWGNGYWIIKNSWGTSWGQSGYGEIATGNVRGFNQWIYYPHV